MLLNKFIKNDKKLSKTNKILNVPIVGTIEKESEMKNIIALAVAVACSSPVFAQSVGQWYGEASYQMTTVTDKSEDDLGKFKTNGISLGLGNVVMNNVAVEGFYNLPSSTASNTYDGPSTIEIKQKATYGFAVRPFISVTNDIELFARVGRVFGKSEWAYKDASSTDGGTGKIANNFYGLGVAYKASKEVSVVADYKKQTGVSGESVSSTSVGIRYNF